jgi:uncharacterized repeat protein (TIGR03806 family)
MWRLVVALVSLSVLGACADGCDEPTVTPVPPRLEGVALERAFPSLGFDSPLLLTAPPGVADRLFVVEQGGRVYTFDPRAEAPEKELFLDLSAKVSRVGNEEGLLGLAFHPDYAQNGRFFVSYSAIGTHSVVAELVVSSDRDRADPASERALLTQEQPYRNHNGGMIAFGPDGHLYVAFGDGGAAGDPEGRAQDPRTWLGKLLRIDVDGGEPFAIPGDNPFADGAAALPEIWALGFRNPWRMSFDRATAALWLGDVGQDRFEEVDIVTRGGNYGWRAFEGYERFDDDELSIGGHSEPIAVYGRNEGNSITGGYVYRGGSLPLLQGVYVFGDFGSGMIWGLRPATGGWERRLLVESGLGVASFGEDAAGELYVCAFDGGIYRVVADQREPEGLPPLPPLLSELGLFSDVAAQTPEADVLAYEVNAPLWSDGADKRRFMRVPAGASIAFSRDGRWQFPDGTVLAKTFALTEPIETRIIRKQGGYWQAASYVWSGADAALALDGAEVALDAGAWSVPSRTQCRSCHTDAAGFVLGVETAQLHRDGQLAELIARGWLVGAPADLDGLPALPRPDDALADVEARARAYLHANCAQCHQPGGPGNATIDLRWTTPLADTLLVAAPPGQGDLGVAGALIIAPGEPERSVLALRMRTRALGAMPPLATSAVDDAGVALIEQWIAALAP